MWLTHLPQLQPDTLPDQAEIIATVKALRGAANPAWIMARVASLLESYYQRDTPQAIKEMEATDWLIELDKFPQWAIDRAVRWWKGPDNTTRHRKPLEGDIAAKCREYVGAVEAVPDLADRIRRGVNFIAPPPRVKVSPERAAQIIAEAGFRVKRFPQIGDGDTPPD